MRTGSRTGEPKPHRPSGARLVLGGFIVLVVSQFVSILLGGFGSTGGALTGLSVLAMLAGVVIWARQNATGEPLPRPTEPEEQVWVCRHCEQQIELGPLHPCPVMQRDLPTVDASDDSGDFLTSFLVSRATGSTGWGFFAGGDLFGSILGSSTRIKDD